MSDSDETDNSTGDEPANPEPEGEALGDGGKRALETERKARRESDRELRDARARIEELESSELRRDVASEKGLTERQAQFLTGGSREDMEARADDLLSAFDTGTAKPQPTARPQEKLKPGASNTDPDDDPRRLADRVMGP